MIERHNKAHAIPSAAEAGFAGRVFCNISADQLNTAFRRVCQSLKVIDFRFHDLRHTAASWLRMSVADIHTVAQLLGDKDLRMAAHYQQLSPAYLSAAVGKLDAVFWELRYQDVTAPNPRLLSAAVSF